MSCLSVQKGVGKPIEWNGLKSSYLIYLIVGVVVLLLVSFLLSLFISAVWVVVFALSSTIFWIVLCVKANRKWGEQGLLHKRVQQALPSLIFMNQRMYILCKHG